MLVSSHVIQELVLLAISVLQSDVIAVNNHKGFPARLLRGQSLAANSLATRNSTAKSIGVQRYVTMAPVILVKCQPSQPASAKKKQSKFFVVYLLTLASKPVIKL